MFDFGPVGSGVSSKARAVLPMALEVLPDEHRIGGLGVIRQKWPATVTYGGNGRDEVPVIPTFRNRRFAETNFPDCRPTRPESCPVHF